MKFSLTFVISLWALFAFTGCADLLNSLREESAAIDKESGNDREEYSDEEYASRPKNLQGMSANNVASMNPPVVRGYGRRLSSLEESAPIGGGGGAGAAAAPEFRRVTRQDFIDSSPGENSLWDDQGQSNYLFSHNRERQPGDLVSADVEKELKREIQYQLWMTLPPEQRRVKRVPASPTAKPGEEAKPVAAAPDKPADEKNRDAAEEAAKTNLASGGKDDDLIRMEVAESLGNGLVRVVGQKRVIYRGAARVVEVMALVNGKDVDDNNRVKSSAFLDMKTQVIQ
jgi:flagellar basal body L-ring protein FlgH